MTDTPGNEAARGIIEEIRRLKLCVLVVDDNPIYRQSLRANLEITYAATVVEADGVSGALAAVSGEAHFDLILMDVIMPVMNGIEACERLRAMGIRTPIVLMSAHSGSVDQSKAEAMGLSLVAKPLDRRALEHLLRDCTGGSSA